MQHAATGLGSPSSPESTAGIDIAARGGSGSQRDNADIRHVSPKVIEAGRWVESRTSSMSAPRGPSPNGTRRFSSSIHRSFSAPARPSPGRTIEPSRNTWPDESVAPMKPVPVAGDEHLNGGSQIVVVIGGRALRDADGDWRVQAGASLTRIGSRPGLRPALHDRDRPSPGAGNAGCHVHGLNAVVFVEPGADRDAAKVIGGDDAVPGDGDRVAIGAPRRGDLRS